MKSVVLIVVAVMLVSCKAHDVKITAPEESIAVSGHLGESIGLNKSTKTVLKNDKRGNSVPTALEMIVEQMAALTNAVIQHGKEQSIHAQMYKNFMDERDLRRQVEAKLEIAKNDLIQERSLFLSYRQRNGMTKLVWSAVLVTTLGVGLWAWKAGWIGGLIGLFRRS